MTKNKDIVPVEKQKTGLPQKTEMRAALVAAKTTGDVKPVHDAAKMLKAAAKSAGDRQKIADATEIVRRAERKLGQLMAEQKLTVGFNKGGAEKGVGRKGKKNAGLNNPAFSPTLAEAGIDKNLAYRARRAAEPDDETFEELLEDELGEILNPSPDFFQIKEAFKERRRLNREKAKAERKPSPVREERRDLALAEDEEERATAPEPKLVAVKSKAKIVPSLTDQCVDKVRTTIEDAVQQMQRGHAPKGKFDHLFAALKDLVEDLEGNALARFEPAETAEQSAEKRRAYIVEHIAS
jgi:hypothetical protein